MRNNNHYYPLYSLILATVILTMVGFSLRFFSNHAKTPLDSESIARLEHKIKRAYLNDKQVFLQPKLTKKQVHQLAVEYQEILTTAHWTEAALKSANQSNTNRLIASKTKINDITERFHIEQQLNALFIPNKAPPQVAISGKNYQADLIVATSSLTQNLDTLKKQILQHTNKKQWVSHASSLLVNAKHQIDAYQQAKQAVDGLYTNKQPRDDLTSEQLHAASLMVNQVKNPTWGKQLTNQLQLASQQLEKITGERIIPFKELADKSLIVISSQQVNKEWWNGPLSFRVKVYNQAKEYVSLSYNQFVLETSEKQISYSTYGKEAVQTLLVKPGGSSPEFIVQFDFHDVAEVSQHQGSQFVYLLSEQPLASYPITSLTIQGKLQKFSEKEVTDDQLSYARKALQAAEIDTSQLSEETLRKYIAQMVIHSATIQSVIQQACQDLQLDYPTAQKKYAENMP